MSVLDILNLIPKSLQQEIVDGLVDVLSKQAEKVLGDQFADKIKKLRSDAGFVQAFQAGLRRAADRFVQEYQEEDEDLMRAIAADEGFFKNRQVQQALLAIIRKPGAYLADERETVLQSFESVLPERRNRQQVDRAVTAFLTYLAEEVWALPELQGVYALQFQRMTAEAIRQQVALQKAQLQATAGLSADFREALIQLTGALAQQRLLAGNQPPALPAPPKVYHNLPQPDYGTFIGREEELAQVHRILRPYPHSQHALVTIDGIGGIGKSTLALEVAHHYRREYDRLPPEERFDAIVWTCAKTSVLTADGIKPRQQITRTLDDLYTTIAMTLEREDITRARPEEQDELVVRALTRQRTLLIVDNLETVDDERVNGFLRELPAPTKAIVTTRHRIDVAYPVRLTGMPQKDGLALIAHECDKKDVTLTEAVAERLYDRTGGVPLAIVWSVAQMGYGHTVEAVLRHLGQPTSEIARFCFGETVRLIRGTDAHRLLMALSLFVTDAHREALGCVAGMEQDVLGRDEGLAVLERLSLVNREADRFSMLPLTHLFARQELEQAPEFRQYASEQLLAYLKQLVRPPQEVRVGVPYWDGLLNHDAFGRLMPERENILQVLRWMLDEHRYSDALDLFLPIVHLMNEWGLWDERLELSHDVSQAASKLGDPSEAWLRIGAIGWVLLQRQQFAECMDTLRIGRSLASQFELADALILADALEARLYARMGNVALARQKIDSALQEVGKDSALEAESKVHLIIATRVFGAAAVVSDAEGDYARTKEMLELERELRESTGQLLAPTLWRLGLVNLQLNDVVAAENLFAQTLNRAGAKDVAWANYGLALVAERKGNLLEARQMCTFALERFTFLELEEGTQECRRLLDRLSG